MSDNSFNGVVNSMMKGMETFLSSKTVVGEPAQVGDTTIIPLVDVTFGIGAGASSQEKKNGGAGGMTGKMSPSAVLIIKDGHVRLVNIKNQDAVTKVLDMIPDIVDRFTKPKDGEMSDADVVDIAFPENERKSDDSAIN